MDYLRKRFGRLLAAHRKRIGLTQEELGHRTGISNDMISKVEIGKSGVSFANIEKLAYALAIDPAELFTTEIPNTPLKRGPLLDIAVTLADLSREDQVWIKGVIEGATGTHPHVVLDHQVGQLSSVDQDNALAEVLHEILRLRTEIRGGDEHPLGRAKTHETANERLNIGSTDRIARRIPFGLHIDPIQSQPIFVDDAIDTPITRTPELGGGVLVRAAVAHCNQ